MFNSHCHTSFSPDSKVDPNDYNNLAHQTNSYFVVTDHVDYDQDTIIDIEMYTETLKKASLDRGLIGIELGMNLDYVEEMTKLFDDQRLDFILGSIHTINSKDVATMLRLSDNPRPIIQSYYEHMLDVVKAYDGFDALGHIDYPMRYTTVPFQVDDPDWLPLIDDIFKCLISRNQTIELNTKLLNQPVHYQSLVRVYKHFHELGAVDITIGSDAHHITQFELPQALIESFLNQTGLQLTDIKTIKKRRLI